jgi:hypothetical protein
MWKSIIIFLVAILLCACSSQKEVVYTTIYPNLQPLQEPNVLSLNTCTWTYPIIKDEKVFIGFDEDNFKCYVENKEIMREQLLLYKKFVDQVNKERAEWNKLNSSTQK